jgi:hypothetical protein
VKHLTHYDAAFRFFFSFQLKSNASVGRKAVPKPYAVEECSVAATQVTHIKLTLAVAYHRVLSGQYL